MYVALLLHIKHIRQFFKQDAFVKHECPQTAAKFEISKGHRGQGQGHRGQGQVSNERSCPKVSTCEI